KLREMANGLNSAYTATLERVNVQPCALVGFGVKPLMWISLAEQPLLIGVLCYALAVDVESPSFDIEMVPPIETVVASCMGLVTIDHASSTVRLVHATLQEYLRSHQGHVFRSPRAAIAGGCLSYLGIPSVRELLCDIETATPAFPPHLCLLLRGAHARKQLTPSIRELALEILVQYPQHAAAIIFLRTKKRLCFLSGSSIVFSGLYYVACFGIDEVSEALLSMGWANLNQRDRTPLILSAEKGHERVVRILPSRADVDPNLLSYDGKTPLDIDSKCGHEGIVRLLQARK
ncbi:hypothetical protein L873DRAFT_1706513, partial [Choiromyces venosus 120613-1]